MGGQHQSGEYHYPSQGFRQNEFIRQNNGLLLFAQIKIIVNFTKLKQ